MPKKAKIIIYDYLDKFLKRVEKEERLHFEKIRLSLNNICIVGIQKAIQTKSIKSIKGHKENIHELIVSTPTLEYRFIGTII